jgi:hypothetical protein
MNKKFEVKNSNIPKAGKGLFALQSFTENEKIANYFGCHISRKEFNTSGIRKFYYLGRKHVLISNEEPYLSENPVNFINESSSPNTYLKRQALYALSNIAMGDELTLKYPKSYHRDYQI